SLGQDVSGTIEIIGVTTESEELKAVTATVHDLPTRAKKRGAGIGTGGGGGELGNDGDSTAPQQGELSFSVDEFSRAIMAKIVKKCG
ncbi:hypothetical protein CNY89_28545, partial [Amaricoccus sp. HAR-UPW-R2A-40]